MVKITEQNSVKNWKIENFGKLVPWTKSGHYGSFYAQTPLLHYDVKTLNTINEPIS